MIENRRLLLQKAVFKKLPVRFWTPYEEGSIRGYVLDIGPRFFLLRLLEYDVRFDGFACFRLSDAGSLQVPDPQFAFIAAALRKRNQPIPRKPRVNLDYLPELLISANQLFPLVTIHRERVAPDTCKIGRVVDVTKSRLSLQEITPDAVWEKKTSEVRLSEITRVGFGGGYEEALHLVGGNPKRQKKSLRPSLL
jgi:hypothetical protein